MSRKAELTGLLFDEPAPPGSEGPPLCTDFFAEVALARPLDCLFTYAVPLELRARVEPGVRVAVPFGHRREMGVVVGSLSAPPPAAPRLKALLRVLDEEPLIDAAMLELTRWIAEEYACSWGEALAAVLPTALKREMQREIVHGCARTTRPSARPRWRARSPSSSACCARCARSVARSSCASCAGA